jgi:Holliday junction DNA helicase RuvB
VFIESAKMRREAMDHVLFFGPPGLGKTTLAQIVARELGVNFRATSGPVIAKAGDLAALLTNLEHGDVLFIDEIHRLNPVVEEVLYPAMEDRALDLIIGEGPSARSVRIDLPPFTLIGATTRQGLLQTPLRDRFGIPVRLQFYTVAELERVVTRGAGLLGIGIDRTAPPRSPAARAARPRRRPPAAPGARFRASGGRRHDHARHGRFGAHPAGSRSAGAGRAGPPLPHHDRRHLQGRAGGRGNAGRRLSEPRDTIEEVIEPYLIQLGLVARTARGRCLNDRGWQHLGLTPPPVRFPTCSTAASKRARPIGVTACRDSVPVWDRVNRGVGNGTSLGIFHARNPVNAIVAGRFICVVRHVRKGEAGC